MNFNTKPFNSYISEEDRLVLEVAIAGFSEDDLAIERTGTQLAVIGKKTDKPIGVKESLNRGISYRDFRDVFIIPTQWKLEVAELINGVLRIKFFEERENVPITVVKPKKVKESA